MNFIDDTSTQTSNLSLSINGSSVDKENTLTFNTPLTRSNNTVSIDLSGYATTSALSSKENVLTFNTPLNRSTNTISIDLSNYATTSALSSKENVLTFNTPLTRSGNIISVDLNGISTNNINVSNTTAGILSVIYGGTGKNTLTTNQILIGNGTSAISQTSNLVYDTSNNLLGVNNSSPIAPLCVGSSGVVSDGYIVVGKRSSNGASRHTRFGYNSAYDFVIGDFGFNNTAGTWLEQFKINYSAPANSLVVDSGGQVSCNTFNCPYLTNSSIQVIDNCKLWCFDDYHYIHFNRPYDTLKIQEVGDIIFYISTSRIEKLRINSSGITASANINTTGNLQEGGVNLSSKYAPLTTYTQGRVLLGNGTKQQ